MQLRLGNTAGRNGAIQYVLDKNMLKVLDVADPVLLPCSCSDAQLRLRYGTETRGAGQLFH